MLSRSGTHKKDQEVRSRRTSRGHQTSYNPFKQSQTYEDLHTDDDVEAGDYDYDYDEYALGTLPEKEEDEKDDYQEKQEDGELTSISSVHRPENIFSRDVSMSSHSGLASGSESGIGSAYMAIPSPLSPPFVQTPLSSSASSSYLHPIRKKKDDLKTWCGIAAAASVIIFFGVLILGATIFYFRYSGTIHNIMQNTDKTMEILNQNTEDMDPVMDEMILAAANIETENLSGTTKIINNIFKKIVTSNDDGNLMKMFDFKAIGKNAEELIGMLSEVKVKDMAEWTVGMADRLDKEGLELTVRIRVPSSQELLLTNSTRTP